MPDRDSFDAIVVAGCPPRADGSPSRAMRRRVERAAALWRAGRAPLLLFTGGVGRVGRPAEGEAAARYAREALGVAPEALLVESESRTTAENARLAAALLRAHRPDAGGLSRVLVVSDGYHGYRCARVFARHFAAVEVASAGNPRPPALLWAAAREAVAIAWYHLRGRFRAGP